MYNGTCAAQGKKRRKKEPENTHLRKGTCVCLSQYFCTFVCVYVFVFRNIFVLNSHRCISSLLQKDFNDTRITNLSCPGVVCELNLKLLEGEIIWLREQPVQSRTAHWVCCVDPLPAKRKYLRWYLITDGHDNALPSIGKLFFPGLSLLGYGIFDLSFELNF